MRDKLYTEVPIETELHPKQSSFIDSMSFISLFITFLFFCAFQFSYVYTSFNTNNVFNDSVVYYPFKTIRNDLEADFELTIGPLTKYHKSIVIHAGLIRDISEESQQFLFKMKGKITYYDERTNVKEQEIPEKEYRVFFKPSDTVSTEFLLYQHNQGRYNRADIQVTFTGELENFTGASIHYSFPDPNVHRYLDSCRIFMFLSIIYSLFGFVYDVVKRKDYNVQSVITLFLASSAILGINPLAYFVPVFSNFDLYFQFVFFCAYRVFILYTLFSLILSNFSKTMAIVISFIASMYTLAEYIISYSNLLCSFVTIPLDVSDNQKFINYSTAFFSLVVIFLSIISIFEATQDQFFKALSYGLFIISAAISTFVSDGFLFQSQTFKNSCFPSILYLSTHFLVTNIFLFFQNTTNSNYTSIEDKENEYYQGGEIYIETESSVSSYEESDS